MSRAFLAPLCCSVKVGVQVEHGLLSLQHLQAAQEAEAMLSTCSLSDVQCNEVYHRITRTVGWRRPLEYANPTSG